VAQRRRKQAGEEKAEAESLPPSFHELEMRWLAEHEAEYVGQWLALDGDRLLSHGADRHKVRAAARAQGVESPFVVFAEDQQEFVTEG
jgi:hypothetical protein